MSKSRTWVFLRGLGRNSGHWGNFIEEFKEQFPQDKIELLDLIGTGTEAHRHSPTQIQGHVEDLRARRKTTGSVSILAISMGAMVATAWAQAHPNEVETLVLINTSGKGLAPFYRRLKFKNYPQIIDMLLHINDRKHFEESVLKLTAKGLKNLDETLERHLSLPATSLINWALHLKSASNFTFPQQAPAPKVLILSGKQDELVDSVCSTILAQKWKAPHREHPTGPHDLPLVEGPWIVRQVKEFA